MDKKLVEELIEAVEILVADIEIRYFAGEKIGQRVLDAMSALTGKTYY